MSDYAGVIVKNKKKVLMVRNAKDTKWVFPKGKVGRLNPKLAALKEVYEEAGVLGELEEKIGVVHLRNKRVTVFVMRKGVLLRSYPEHERKRKWLTMERVMEEVPEYEKILSRLV